MAILWYKSNIEDTVYFLEICLIHLTLMFHFLTEGEIINV